MKLEVWGKDSALAEDLSLVPSTCVRMIAYNFRSRGSNVIFWSLRHCVYMTYTHTDTHVYTHKIKQVKRWRSEHK